jgi:hypothetical protein
MLIAVSSFGDSLRQVYLTVLAEALFNSLDQSAIEMVIVKVIS